MSFYSSYHLSVVTFFQLVIKLQIENRLVRISAEDGRILAQFMDADNERQRLTPMSQGCLEAR